MWGMISCVGNRTQYNLWLVDISCSTAVRAEQCAEHFCPKILSRSFVNSAMTYEYAFSSTTACARSSLLWNRAFVKGACSHLSCPTSSSRRLQTWLIRVSRRTKTSWVFWGHLKKKQVGRGGRGEASAREPALATSLWGMLYDDEAGVVL